MHIKNEKKSDKTKTIILSGIFSILFLCQCLFLRQRIWYILDSDMSSEMILATLLNEERSIFADGWYYATELRLLYMPQIFRILFLISDNWHFVRVYSTVIIYLIYVAAASFLSRRLSLGTRAFILGSVIIMPFSIVYGEYVLMCPYYIPCIAISFGALAMDLHCLAAKTLKERILLIAGSSLLAFLSSLIGPRQIVMFYFPVIITSGIILIYRICKKQLTFRKAVTEPFFLICFADIMVAGTAYLINIFILPKYYYFVHWNQIKLKPFRIKRLIKTLGGMARMLGADTDAGGIRSVVSVIYVSLLIAMFICFVFYALRYHKQVSAGYVILSLYSVCAAAVLALLYSFTNMIYYDLYSVPIVVFVYPVVILGFKEHPRLNKSTVRIPAVICLSVLFMAMCLFNYNEIGQKDKTSEHKEIARYLTENGYLTGYATFWNANVLTELTNGQIEVYAWNDSALMNEVENVDDINEWLQKKSHSSVKPTGKVFTLYTYDDEYNCRWKDRLREEDKLLQTADMVVYGYESYEEMKDRLGD